METGAIEPGTAGGNTHDYRYVIQNDLKWTYATNPFATGSTGAGQVYNAPRGAPGFHSTYDGYTAQGRDAAWTYIVDETAASGKTSAANTNVLTPTNETEPAAGDCNHDSEIHSGTNSNQYFTYKKGTVGGYANMLLKWRNNCEATGQTSGTTGAGTCSGGTSTGNETSLAQCNAVNGTWTYANNEWGYVEQTSGTDAPTEEPLLYNRVQWFLTAAGAPVATGSTGGMHAQIAILYQLLIYSCDATDN